MAVDLPGRESDAIARIARKYKTFICASAKVRHEHFPGRYFNVAFVLSPDGEIVHRHYKCQAWVKERSLTPTDVYSRWLELYGDSPEVFFPVAKLPIGNLGTTICMEGSFPEIYRGLALNGAEIITRPTYPEPWVSQGQFQIQNQARALDNTCYLIAPNHASTLRSSDRHLIGGGNGGQSMIVDYRGQILTCLPHATEGFTAAIIDVDRLRRHRQRSHFCNFIPYLRTELYGTIYQQTIWPADQCLTREPGNQAEAKDTFSQAVKSLTARGTFSPD